MAGAGDDGELGVGHLLGHVTRPGEECFVELTDDHQRRHGDRRQGLDHVAVDLRQHAPRAVGETDGAGMVSGTQFRAAAHALQAAGIETRG